LLQGFFQGDGCRLESLGQTVALGRTTLSELGPPPATTAHHLARPTHELAHVNVNAWGASKGQGRLSPTFFLCGQKRHGGRPGDEPLRQVLEVICLTPREMCRDQR
jgi:hypothetical protein